MPTAQILPGDDDAASLGRYGELTVARLRQQVSLLDVAVAAVVVAVLLGEIALNDESTGFSVPAVLAVMAAGVPLVFRRSHPLVVLVLCAVTLFLVLDTCAIYQTVALPPMVALYTYARLTDRRRSLLAGLAWVPVVLLALGIYSPHDLFDLKTAQNLPSSRCRCWPATRCGIAAQPSTSLHQRVETAERTREEEALRRVGEERLRIARDVHDVVAHSMVAINVQAGVAAHLLERRPEEARGSLETIRRVSGEAIADLRATLGVLRDAGERAPVRPAQGLDSLDELADSMRAAGIELEVERRGESRPLPSAVDAAGYRIVQEALTNVLRHAHATRAGVMLDVGVSELRIEVSDDGVGAAPNGHGNGALPAGSGNGLRGMRERATAVGGRVEAGEAGPGGWRVAALPAPAALDERSHPGPSGRRPGARARRLPRAARRRGGHRGRRRGRRRARGARPGTGGGAPGGADGRAHAAHGRPRGHRSDHVGCRAR